MSSIVRINPVFNQDSHSILFEDTGFTPNRVNVLQFQRQNSVKLDDSIALMNELPPGTVIAGGNFRQRLLNQSVNNYDLFFDSEAAFLSTIRRIMHAPEGAVLHGYTPKISVAKFSESKEPILTFVHPMKPAIQLIRTRWFDNSEKVLQHIDLVDSVISLNYDMIVDHHSEAVRCAKNRHTRIHHVDFRIGTGERLLQRNRAGLAFFSYNNYGNYEREDLMERARRYIMRKGGQNVDTRFVD